MVMKHANQIKKNIKFKFCFAKREVIGILCILCGLILTVPVFSQEAEFTVTGRVINEKGQPIPKADVRLSTLGFTFGEDAYLTDDEGKFSITRKTPKGKTLYLYVSDGSYRGRIIISPPFDSVNEINKRFLGKPVLFGDKTVIDVGDVNVQFWFANVHIKFQKKEKNLSKKDWESLWLILEDEQGKIIAEATVGPTITDFVDLEKSVLKLSLPEGNWRIKFQKYSFSKNKLYPKIIGQTPYFVIDKDKEAETINVLP